MDVKMRTLALIFVAAPFLVGCGGGSNNDSGVKHRQITDALYSVMEADRQVYAEMIVHRLANEEEVIKTSEHWRDDKALILPAEMFRYGAERVSESDAAVRYALISPWPINSQNNARTDVEKAGIEALAEDPGTPYYATETLAGQHYFTALYPDRAVSEACIQCHNDHRDSPRDDFEMDEVMGAIVIRLPLDQWGGRRSVSQD
jgi:hypothetical protein